MNEIASSEQWGSLIGMLKSISTSTTSTWATTVQLLVDEWGKLSSAQRVAHVDTIDSGLRFTVLYDKKAEDWAELMKRAGVTSARLPGAPVVASPKFRKKSKVPMIMAAFPLITANAIIEHAFAHAQAIKSRPLCVTILDAGGHVIAMQRQDGAGFLRVEVSGGKAYGALGMGAPSSILAKR